jgi:hypothetical protein
MFRQKIGGSMIDQILLAGLREMLGTHNILQARPVFQNATVTLARNDFPDGVIKDFSGTIKMEWRQATKEEVESVEKAKAERKAEHDAALKDMREWAEKHPNPEYQTPVGGMVDEGMDATGSTVMVDDLGRVV